MRFAVLRRSGYRALMPTFSNDGLTLRYEDAGEGDPIVLVHGFGSNLETNWTGTGWVTTLTKAGYRVVTLDNRGHGQSEKPHDPQCYTPAAMAGDVIALADELALRNLVLMGYSMGARISAFATLRAPSRVRALVLGGLGEGLVTGLDDAAGISIALLTDDVATIISPRGRMFREFADRTKSDRAALAACIATSRETLTPEQVASIEVPAFVAVGTADDLAGSPDALAAMFPRGRSFTIEGRDHMSAVGDRSHKAAVLDFLASLDPPEEAD